MICGTLSRQTLDDHERKGGPTDMKIQISEEIDVVKEKLIKR